MLAGIRTLIKQNEANGLWYMSQASVTFQVYELRGNELHKIQEVEKQARFKCGTFGASSLAERQLATGSFQGHLQVSVCP